ncbi:bifunctional riboflavin kinase/FAD synthetase [Thauera sp.]|uniref:bifunctional riboflavin kinase/FAD synthetase n=1 Tax=Thauera sp. TaxID=1905334 RepID=UPI002588A3F2|nr:bifunctional riboflavin kinase/FAD synthetase [Thauera sp.]
MQVHRGIPEHADTPAVLTIGNFDGVHRGHQALLSLLTGKARALGLPAVVLTFEPHPREYFSPADAPARLASLREKLLLLQSAGVDRTYICRFDARVASQSAQSFIDDTLVRGLGVRHLFIGDDFRFGARRQGSFAMLQEAGVTHGFGVESMPTLCVDDERVSSSAVRNALLEDDLGHAARLLGRPYSIAGRVSHGDKLGRQLGFPTANIQMKHRRPALTGVYVVSVEGLAEERILGVANIGVRPTATARGRARLEVHLFEWSQNCYGAHIRVHFLHKLRSEQKFDSLDALRTQIALDSEAARQWFADRPAVRD